MDDIPAVLTPLNGKSSVENSRRSSAGTYSLDSLSTWVASCWTIPPDWRKVAPKNRVMEDAGQDFDQFVFQVRICASLDLIPLNSECDFREKSFLKVLRGTVLNSGTVKLIEIGLPNRFREGVDKPFQYSP